MGNGVYEELFDLLIDPTGDPSGIKATPVHHGKDILSFCPIHEATGEHRRRSLKLSPSRIGLHCFAMCEFDEIVEALYRRANLPLHSRRPHDNVTPLRQDPPPAQRYPEENLVSLYEYRVPDGDGWKVVGEKGRFEFPVPGESKPSKVFGWRIPGSTWQKGLRAGGLVLTDMPLYDLKTLADAHFKAGGTVWITEGEAARQALVARNIVALCPPGGASSKDFGTAMDVLKGHDVVVWPDNDEPGRQFAVSVTQAVQKAGARSVRVHIPAIALPPKGDAVEYFQLGGTVEDLDRQAITEPVPELLAMDSVAVHIPSEVGIFHWELRNVAIANRSTDGRLSVWLENPSFQSLKPYTQRINIDSASSVDMLRKTLEAYFQSAGGKGLRFVEMINTVFSLFRETLAGAEKAVDVADLVFDEEQDMEIAGPLVVADGHTIWFGDGSTGKSFLAYGLAVAMAYNLPFAGLKVKPGKVMVIDWEASKTSFGRRLYRILNGYRLPRHEAGRILYRNAAGMPLSEIIDDIKEQVDKNDVRFAIFDSIGPACGGEPEKADIAIRYFQLLHRLGIPTLSIAHVTKAGEDSKPIGSAFFHNMARRTFFLLASSDSSVSDKKIGFFCKKVNDGMFPEPQGVRIRFDDSSPMGIITFDSTNEAFDNRASKKLRYQIHDILDSQLTLEEIIEELGLSKTSTNRGEVFREIQANLTGADAMFYSEARVIEGIETTFYGRVVKDEQPPDAATGTDGPNEILPDDMAPPAHDDRWENGSAVWDS